MRNLIIYWILTFVMFPIFMAGQVTVVDSLAVDQPISLDSLPPNLKDFILSDSTKKKKGLLKRLFKDDQYPNPKRAMYYSLIVPGMGQVYNRHYLKLPIIYGLYTAAVINIRNHRVAYKFYRDNRIYALDEDDTTVNITNFDAASLQTFRDRERTAAETGYLLLIGLHLLQTADAFVFAHLKTFDVSDDLSLRVGPELMMPPGGMPGAGLNFSLTLKATKKERGFRF